jgi:hypothetical protein
MSAYDEAEDKEDKSTEYLCYADITKHTPNTLSFEDPKNRNT